jgi:23S rRNA (uracil1939-C5)-methyltransferase
VRRSRPGRPSPPQPSRREKPYATNAAEIQRTRDLKPALIDLKIQDVAYGGAGVGRIDGLVVFVPGTIPGETVRVRPLRMQKRFCEAELVEILSPSPLRQTPVCEWFGRCGGCAYQHVPYATQLEWKTFQVRELLQRIAKIKAPPVQPAVPSPLQFGYRNRIRVHVAIQEGALRVGFYAKRGRQIVDVQECPIASAPVNQKLAALRKTLPGPGEFVVSERPEVLFFEQTNDGAAAALVELVASLVENDQELLVDAYCGAGFFGSLLASRFSRVAGIESHPGAIDSARKKAATNESYFCGDVSVHLPAILASADPALTTVLLDPPAAGVSSTALEILGRQPVAKLLYVSCDPATQARDLGALVAQGYRLETVVPVDMFPQTADIEVVAVLSGAAKTSPNFKRKKNMQHPRLHDDCGYP